MKKVQLLLCMIVLLGCLSGCTNYAKKYSENTLVIKGNDSLVEVAVEDYKDTSVKSEELSVYITEQIDQFNKKQDANKIKKKDLITEDMSKVTLVLTYKDIESYNEFNLLECVLCDFSEIEKKQMKGSFTSADGDSVKYADMEGTKKAKVFITSEKTNLVVDGDILYYNKEVSVKDGKVSTTGKGNAIIVFK